MGARARTTGRRRRWFGTFAAAAMVMSLLPASAVAQDDPRIGLGGGQFDAEQAISNLEMVANWSKADGGLFNPDAPTSSSYWISDIAFQDDLLALGNFYGYQLFDVSDPADPRVIVDVVCPGGQGDPSIYGNLLFRSVEQGTGRIDCGTQGNSGPTAAETRFRGIQIWDVSDPEDPKQVGGVQLCRGSHTHTVVEDLNDPDHVYIYNSGTSGSGQNSGDNTHCNSGPADTERPSRWMTEVIKVPLANPAAAEVVNEARLFTDPNSGAVNGLGNVNHCHDITAYPEIGLAAGACQGRGLLIDITDPANPTRVDAVADSNFSYWHSATWNNDGTKVVFTDEWGGGTGARCRASDPMIWGANGIYDVVQTEDGPRLEFRSYYKLPVPQTSQENCVSHNGSLIPVPGRDIMVQAWYQGGTSIFDFTDSANPVEIAYFDRGPVAANLVTGGHWSSYWYNGLIYGSEIARGLDVFRLVPSEHLSANEIAVAESVTFPETNVQAQVAYAFEPSFTLSRAYRDQAERAGMDADLLANVDKFLDRAERFQSGPQARAAIANLRALANQLDDAGGYDDLSASLRDLADAMS
ncbi:LVIVD repeat-containing protein [Egicoccus sp. AB-alg2]|uniref:LVIVD repeat-containing protein n=1 Tax=Egicoccus sp. AB-alg2 TaxID=3242693 RepID=UPI00359EF31E